MARVICDISTSLDGFIAGPNQTLEQPLGEGGEGLHEWAYELASFRERHGMDGGETGADDEVVQESLAAQGAVVLGRGGCSAAEQARGRTTPMRTAGGGTTLRSAFRCSSSPTTLVNPSQSKAEPRSRSSPTGSKPHSSKLGRPPATGTCWSQAAPMPFSSPSGRGCSTSFRSISFRCFSATAFACSTTSAPRKPAWSSIGWSIPPPSPI